MTATTTTTAFSVLMTAVSPSIPIKCFAFIAFNLVVINYLFVIFHFPAVLFLVEKFKQRKGGEKVKEKADKAVKEGEDAAQKEENK